MPKTIRQTVTIKASPHAVYEALMDSRKHSAFSRMPARISRTPGGRFTAYGPYLSGVNLELVPDKKIVQFWRARNWPTFHYSTVTFALSRVKGGTRLAFTQAGVPDNDYTAKKRGWIKSYWVPMKAMLEKKR
ncbi:MAG TPA: SRPBCC family protein [Candidatus Acidoferrales bacterium]|jgi:activator of HSP90 ATPase|nr:SRPBCC family protein [Candidatus Acidoferrales bacterium]